MPQPALPSLSPVELLQRLIRFDTTNPPGDERACVLWIDELLRGAGLTTTIVGRSAERPNVIARLRGSGEAPALLLQGHVDVVTTAHQSWTRPPFEGIVNDGFVWGRGALDMKGGVAMMLWALLDAATNGARPRGDIVFAAMSDEEAGSDYGARYLVEEHPALFDGVRYAIGEFGGFTFDVAGRRFYPIQVAEKQICHLRLRLRGAGGHGSLPMRGGAMATLARVLGALDERRLPVHVTSTARAMLAAMAAALPFPMSAVMRGLARPATADRLLNVLGARLRFFDPLLHNTVNATVVAGGDAVNVIPSEIELLLDGRMLPGVEPAHFIAEVRDVLAWALGRHGADALEIDVLRHDPFPAGADMGLFETLADILRAADPGAVPVPLLLSGVTDARFFARLGIQNYGFLPMPLPAGFDFAGTIHAADERIPTAAVEFGARAVRELLRRR